MSDWSTCALCPRLCRSACPVSLGSGREAAVPAVMAATLLQIERGAVDASLAAEVLTLCTDCGACQDHCHLHVPFPERLRQARLVHVPAPPIDPLQAIEGEGEQVVVLSDEREWGQAFSAATQQPVRTWRTSDDLGVAQRHHPVFQERAERIRLVLTGLEPIVVSGGVAEVLEQCGVPYRWLTDVLPQLPRGHGSCTREGKRPLACCGAAGPLALHHPEDAARVGRLWLDRVSEWTVVDARCRGHLNRCGGRVKDPVDALLAGDFVH